MTYHQNLYKFKYKNKKTFLDNKSYTITYTKIDK